MLTGLATGRAGRSIVFAKVKQGDVVGWAPLDLEIKLSVWGITFLTLSRDVDFSTRILAPLPPVSLLFKLPALHR